MNMGPMDANNEGAHMIAGVPNKRACWLENIELVGISKSNLSSSRSYWEY